MPRNPSSRWFAVALLLVVAHPAFAADVSSKESPVDLASKQVITYLTNLADLLCRESVLQEKLAPNGHVDTFERSNYEYFILMDGDGDNFQLTESRVETSQTPRRPLPLLVTNGFSSLLLIFHPYYRDSFRFEVGLPEGVNDQMLLAVHFTQLPGHRSPAAIALRGRQYALQFQGTAWLDEHSGQVMKIDASLAKDMSDIGLRSLHITVNYSNTSRGPSFTSLVLPTAAVVDVESIRQHWRNTHTFSNYKTFSTSAEQDPNVKLHQPPAADGSDTTEPTPQHPPKETH